MLNDSTFVAGASDGIEFIYKETLLARLADICDRLTSIYESIHGKDKVVIWRESGRVVRSKLPCANDPTICVIQITYVAPYVDALPESVEEGASNSSTGNARKENTATGSGERREALVLAEDGRKSQLDTAYNIDTFMFETPYSKAKKKKAHAENLRGKQFLFATDLRRTEKELRKLRFAENMCVKYVHGFTGCLGAGVAGGGWG